MTRILVHDEQSIANRIFTIRGKKVMLDRHLLYLHYQTTVTDLGLLLLLCKLASISQWHGGSY